MRHSWKARPAAAVAAAAATLVVYLMLSSSASGQTSDCGGLFQPPCTTTTTTIDTTTTTTTLPTTTETTLPTTSTTQPPQWDGSRWTTPSANGDTVADGSFSGIFKYAVAATPIESVDLDVAYSPTDVHAAACGDGKQSLRQTAPSTSTSEPSTESTMEFLFEAGFVCNGIYDVTATATAQPSDSEPTTGELSLSGLHIAVPPPAPLSLTATDNGNQTVTLSWEHPANPPVDTIGYRISQRTASAQSFTPIVDTEVDAATYSDSKFPSGGGDYVFKVESLRKSPNGTLTSYPVVTEGALSVAGVEHRGRSGGTVGGTVPPNAGGTGAQHYDTTLPGDDEASGQAEPGGDTIQRFDDDAGAGLIKPFAGALNLGVWAALLLFLTRRAATADRAALQSIHVE